MVLTIRLLKDVALNIVKTNLDCYSNQVCGIFLRSSNL